MPVLTSFEASRDSRPPGFLADADVLLAYGSLPSDADVDVPMNMQTFSPVEAEAHRRRRSSGDRNVQSSDVVDMPMTSQQQQQQQHPLAAAAVQKRRKSSGADQASSSSKQPSGAKPHKCPYCSRGFARSEHKERHIRTRKLSLTHQRDFPPALFILIITIAIVYLLQPALSISVSLCICPSVLQKANRGDKRERVPAPPLLHFLYLPLVHVVSGYIGARGSVPRHWQYRGSNPRECPPLACLSAIHPHHSLSHLLFIYLDLACAEALLAATPRRCTCSAPSPARKVRRAKEVGVSVYTYPSETQRSPPFAPIPTLLFISQCMQ